MLRRYIPYYTSLLKLAMPLVLTQAGQMSVQLIDNAMVGRFGTAELAASSFANSIYVVIMLFGLGVCLGITPLVGRARGANEDRRVATIMKSGFALSAILIPAITLLAGSMIWIMPYMGQTEEVVRLAIPYYKTLVVALVPFLLFTLLKQIGEGLGNTVVEMAATIAANLLNVVLNYIFIFGKLGFPAMGLLGAGYATLISRIAMPLILYAGFWYLKPIRHYFLLMWKVKATLPSVANIFRVGLPIATQLVLEVSAFTVSSIMMGWLGNVPLASHQIAMGLASFTFMIANGVAMATTIRVSFQFGTRDFASMEKASYSAVHLVVAFMGFCGLGFLLFRYQLPYLFTTDTAVIEQAASLILVAALFELFDGLQVVCLGILRGLADVKAPMFIAGFSYMVVGLTVSYLCAFVFHMGPEGIWYGFLAGLAAAGILLALRIRHDYNTIIQNSRLEIRD
ncbi:MAG: MATE family efflux transporter [Acidobacteriota bacterium]|nr:MATE family efflux transporter [Acidobacteriota bacterium]